MAILLNINLSLIIIEEKHLILERESESKSRLRCFGSLFFCCAVFCLLFCSFVSVCFSPPVGVKGLKMKYIAAGKERREKASSFKSRGKSVTYL